MEIQPYPGETGGLPRRKLIPLSLLGNHDHLLYDYVANKFVYPYTLRLRVVPHFSSGIIERAKHERT